MELRFARPEDADQISLLRRQVHALHAQARPDIFRAGFHKDLEDYVHVLMEDPDRRILAADRDGRLIGYAILCHVKKPRDPYMRARNFLGIEEFGVDPAFRRQGVASAMLARIRKIAEDLGTSRIELSVWEFNRDALAFYEAAGFTVCRRYLELDLD